MHPRSWRLKASSLLPRVGENDNGHLNGHTPMIARLHKRERAEREDCHGLVNEPWASVSVPQHTINTTCEDHYRHHGRGGGVSYFEWQLDRYLEEYEQAEAEADWLAEHPGEALPERDGQ